MSHSSTSAGGEGGRSGGVPFIAGLQPHVPDICSTLVKETDKNRQEVLSAIVLCLAVSGSESQAGQVLGHLVSMATTQQPLSLFVRILSEGEIKHRSICASSMQHILSCLHQQQGHEEEEEGARYRALANLRTIVQWENTQQR